LEGHIGVVLGVEKKKLLGVDLSGVKSGVVEALGIELGPVLGSKPVSLSEGFF
jgi:hypothetical protein